MMARWQALSARFAALQKRERLMVAGAIVVTIVMGGHGLWVEPATMRADMLARQVEQNTSEIRNLQGQLAALRPQLKDPDAPRRAALADVTAQLSKADQALHQYDTTLVPPEQVPKLLQSLFVHHRGLQLVSLQTLPQTPLLAPPRADAKASDAKAPAPAGPTIHKHGIEIKVAGNYLDLLAYIEELERMPQKLLWGRMSLTVTAYPRSELTLTVYTLSLDETWMVV